MHNVRFCTRANILYIFRQFFAADDLKFYPILSVPNKIRRTESVPSGINNQVERPTESQQYGTLPKAINKKACGKPHKPGSRDSRHTNSLYVLTQSGVVRLLKLKCVIKKKTL